MRRSAGTGEAAAWEDVNVTDKRLAVIGAGIIGRTHLDAISAADGFRVSGIVEPGPAGAEIAARYGTMLYGDFAAMLADRPQGIVIATPNESHVELAVRAVQAGIPVLVEKPVATSVNEARKLLDAIDRHGVPVMTGHHRRFNPIILKARDIVAGGRFGHLVQGSVLCSLRKEDAYFDVEWRRTPGIGGPLLINMIHEIDLLRFLFGEIATVTGIVSNAERGLPVEDTAGAILTFRDGGAVTLSVSDAACGPWAWDIAAGENPGRFPAHKVQSHFFAGSACGFSLPDLTVWTHPGEKTWYDEMRPTRETVEDADSYIGQVRHFGDVIDGRAAPRCSALDGARNLAIVDAIKASAESGMRLRLDASGLGAAAPEVVP